jgi:hypothetical protein
MTGTNQLRSQDSFDKANSPAKEADQAAYMGIPVLDGENSKIVRLNRLAGSIKGMPREITLPLPETASGSLASSPLRHAEGRRSAVL